jgi:hypothetical protein
LDLDVDLFLGGIDGSDVGDALECLCGFLVLWGKVLAVSAPGGIELYQPDALLGLLEIGGGEAADGGEAVVEGGGADGQGQQQ